MHAFLIERLAIELRTKLLGKELLDAFTTSKHEINIIFDEIALKINFFQGLAFFQTPNIAKLQKKNRLPIFKSIVGFKVSAIDTFPFDRSFSLCFDNKEILRFYGYGKFSQLTHYKSDKWLENFPLKSKQIPLVEHVKDVDLTWLTEEVKVEELKFLDSSQQMSLIASGFNEDFIQNKKKSLLAIYRKSLNNSLFVNKMNHKYELSFEKRGETISTFDSTLHACDQFARLYISNQVFVQTKSSHLNALKKEHQRILKRFKSAQIQIKELSNGQKYKDKADLIMANLWQIDKGMKEVNLPSFDGENQVLIKLKKDLSPQDNATRLYKKGKNEKIRLRFANEALKIINQELVKKTEEIGNIEQMNEMKDLRKEANLKQEKHQIKLPYRVVYHQGFEIRIGKGARENDELLRNFTTKFDKWLHAKDVSGSHVVIRNPSQNQISMDVIERAAQLAAYYSKAKNEGMAAVIYTDRKYVRKPKGAHPGMVKVDREYTILVEPQQ